MKTCERLVRYGDIVYSYLNPEETFWETRMPAHVLIYVRQGILRVTYKRHTEEARAGEVMFIRREHKVKIQKSNDGELPYSAISIRLERKALMEHWRNIRSTEQPKDSQTLTRVCLNLSSHEPLMQLFERLKPYVDGSQIPSAETIDHEQHEAIRLLLQTDVRFYPTLFDFAQPWKIDIMRFMEKNFAEDLTLAEIANYTGRSFATFKRDFAKLCDLSPERWLTERRLQAAYDLIANGHLSVNDAYERVGFKNRSHFSFAFKNKFGVAPSMVTMV